jgi:hypothetical protein
MVWVTDIFVVLGTELPKELILCVMHVCVLGGGVQGRDNLPWLFCVFIKHHIISRDLGIKLCGSLCMGQKNESRGCNTFSVGRQDWRNVRLCRGCSEGSAVKWHEAISKHLRAGSVLSSEACNVPWRRDVSRSPSRSEPSACGGGGEQWGAP